MRRARWLLVGCALALPMMALAVPKVTEADRDRYQALLHELRCVVCQNQSIAESDAPLAEDLRRQVAEQINDGRSNAEIRAYLTDRYGDFVLYNPPLRPTTWALWFGPFILLIVGLFIAVWQLRRRAPSVATVPKPGNRQQESVQALLERYPERQE